MRKIPVILALSLLIAGIAGTVLADSNTATQFQVGNGSGAGPTNTATINQTGASGSTALQGQGATTLPEFMATLVNVMNNNAYISQSGTGDLTTQFQFGNGNTAQAFQFANGDSAY